MTGFSIARAPMLVDATGRPVGLIGTDGQEYYLPRYSSDMQSLLKPDGSALAGQGAGYVLQPATSTVLGGVKAGPGVSIAADGALTVTSGGGGSSANDIAFTQAIPLTNTAGTYMPVQSVTGALTFIPAAGAVRGASTFVFLVANAANVPDVSAFTEHGSSMGYDNRAGILNIANFFNLGGVNWVSWSQAYNPQPVPVAASGLTLNGPTSGVVSQPSGTFNVAANGTLSGTVIWTASDGNAGGTFNPASGSTPGSFTYTPASTGAKTISITNNGGLTNPSPITYTATAVAFTQLNNLTRVAQTGSGPYSYAYNGPGGAGTWLDGSGGVSNQLAANSDGSIAMGLNVIAAANGFLLGVTNGASKVSYTSTLYAVYSNDTDGQYKTITGGNPSNSTGSGVAGQVNDIMRLRRAGTSLIAEVARAATPTTWITIRTWTGVPTTAVYFQVDVSGTGSIGQNITGVGLS